jgi:hypothetical protein
VKKKIDEASNQIEETERRTRVISRTLRDVEALPAEQTAQVLSAASVTLPEDLADENSESDETDLFLPHRQLDK